MFYAQQIFISMSDVVTKHFIRIEFIVTVYSGCYLFEQWNENQSNSSFFFSLVLHTNIKHINTETYKSLKKIPWICDRSIGSSTGTKESTVFLHQSSMKVIFNVFVCSINCLQFAIYVYINIVFVNWVRQKPIQISGINMNMAFKASTRKTKTFNSMYRKLICDYIVFTAYHAVDC